MHFIRYWLPTVLWMGVIFYFSSRPRIQVSDDTAVQFLFFKTLHVLEYAVLYTLLYRTFRNTRSEPVWKHRFHAFLTAAFYAVTDEIHQVFIPTREGRMRDVFIDTLGITISMIFLWKLLPAVPVKLKVWAKKLQVM